ncbi:MAG: T9SS type A sorting domain-containing protein, partial [Candidatus Marinimicrobia bacterium]|nr:T9SS type A sorting domain-containing protein [Candidatus Neomarinimicrobiota bacterium]
IKWSYTGGDSLLRVIIGTDNVVSVTTDPSYFGPDTIIFTATNPDGLSSTGAMAVRVNPRIDGPPLWYPLIDEVEVVSGNSTPLFILKQRVKDDFTPFGSLVITPVVNPDPLKPLTVTTIDPAVDSTALTVPTQNNYLTWLYFTATDAGGLSSQSDTIFVDVRDSFSPVWQRIPAVRMETNSIYRDTLNKYISDRDTPLANLTLGFDPASVDSRITVSYDAITTELVIRSSGAPSSSFLTLLASDPLPEGNTTNFSLEVTVAQAFDIEPPDGAITYFFHPVSNRWINYVVVADSTASQFKPNYIKRINLFTVRDEPLAFVQRDSLPGLQTWVAPKKFPAGGVYELTVDLIDYAANVKTLSLDLAVALSKSSGDIFASPDQQLTISYPPLAIENDRLIVLAEMPEPEDLRLPGHTLGASRGAKDRELRVGTIYALDTNLPEPILVTFTYHQEQLSGAYYSFYEVEGTELLKIETYTRGAGQFQADVLTGRDIIFGPSDSRAHDGPLPEGYLLSYPNPFNATLQLRFLLRSGDTGRIVIYNILGREIFSTLKRPFSAGVNGFSWHGINQQGQPVPTGLYFIQVQTDGGTVLTRKVTLLK